MRDIQWSSRALTLLALVSMFAFTFLLVLPWHCRDWHHSLYFRGHPKADQYLERATDLNNKRLLQAEQYFKELKHVKGVGSVDNSDRRLLAHQSKEPQEPKESKGSGSPRQIPQNLDLTVAIIGMQRKKDEYAPKYWLQTAAEVHRQYIKDTYFRRKRLFICNVDHEAKAMQDFHQINKTLEVIFRFGGRYPNQSVVEGTYARSKHDYAFCLNRASRPTSNYVLMIEDDALIKPDFFPELYHHLHTNLPLLKERGLYSKPWGFIKLYYPEKWLGYGLEYQHFIELLGIMLCGGSLTAFVFCIIKTCMSDRCWSSRMSVFCWFLVGALYFLCVCVSVGRPYVVDFLRGTFSQGRLIPAHDCCTPAVLYHGDVVAHLSHNLSATERTRHYDLMMASWARDNGFQNFLAQPNMLSHIGLVSTQNKNAKLAIDFIF